MAEEKKVSGIINALERKNTSGGEPFYNMKIDKLFYNWFNPNMDLNVNNYVVGTYIEVPNPRNPTKPYRNIKALVKQQAPSNLPTPQTESERSDVYELGMAKNGAIEVISRLAIIGQNSPESALEELKVLMQNGTYHNLVVALFNEGRRLREELLEKKKEVAAVNTGDKPIQEERI